MGRRADGAIAEVWRGRLGRQRCSGLSVAEFCRREEVSPASFYRWRRLLARRKESPSQGTLFVPVELPSAGTCGGVQIELPGGAVVTLPVEASVELVTAVIRAAMHGASNEEAPSC